MHVVEYKVLLAGAESFAGRLPPHDLGRVLTGLPKVVRQATSMAMRNRSAGAGARPLWLSRAADIRFVGCDYVGGALLRFEAPPLGEAAADVYALPESTAGFHPRPSADDTGFDLLADVLRAVAGGDADSGRFDRTLLRRILWFREVFAAGPFQRIEFDGRRSPAVLDAAVAQSAASLLKATPPPTRVRIVGDLVGLDEGTLEFSLLLDTGERIFGVFDEAVLKAMRALRGRQTLVEGWAIFRASGRLLRVEAESVRPGDSASRLFSRMPLPARARLDPASLRRPQGPRGGVASIVGKWPGDETDEELDAVLERLS